MTTKTEFVLCSHLSSRFRTAQSLWTDTHIPPRPRQCRHRTCCRAIQFQIWLLDKCWMLSLLLTCGCPCPAFLHMFIFIVLPRATIRPRRPRMSTLEPCRLYRIHLHRAYQGSQSPYGICHAFLMECLSAGSVRFNREKDVKHRDRIQARLECYYHFNWKAQCRFVRER